ncbi:MAG: AAA family ATPase [Deltaproteobacteria bacterium]|nr:AAA family ATPase [Deltaproteobacteria bacterium]
MTSTSSRAADDFTGTSRFAVVRRLGAGGAGIVYEAHDRELGVRVALKRLRRLSPDAILRFKSEFRAVEDVEHPNLVALGELFEEGGQWFFTMEFVDGVDLLQWVRRPSRGSIPDSSESDRTLHDATPPAADPHASPPVIRTKPARDRSAYDQRRLRTTTCQLLRALEALHAAGKVHRDVKPSNVVVTPEGRAVLLDFGLAVDAVREARPGQNGAGGGAGEGIVGTASYMAPEQAVGLPVDARADMYSVGVVLYRALTGRLPFDRVPEPGDAQVPDRPSSIDPGVPDDLDALCMDLLRRSPELRPSATEALRRIEEKDENAPGLSAPALASIAPPPPRRFVGRELEMAMLREAFDETLRGECVVVGVTGESGLGKSTLVRHFGELVAAEYGAVVLSGRCWERETMPYKAVDGIIDALARWLARLPRTDARAILPANAALLAQAFPSLRPIVSELAATAPADAAAAPPASAPAGRAPKSGRSFHGYENTRQRAERRDSLGPRSERAPIDAREARVALFAAARALFAELAQRLPVVLVVDDLQWSDADGLALLREIVRAPDAPSILLVATVRDVTRSPAGETSSASELVERIRDDARALAVEPLDAEDARALALDVLAPSLRGRDDARIAGLADVIAREAAGHPLFVDALARSAIAMEAGAASLGGRATDDAPSSDSRIPVLRLEDAIMGRVGRLDPSARRVVEVAAVAGAPLRMEILSHAAEASLETLPRLVRGLQIARLARTRGEGRARTVEPYHDRVREAVLARIEGDERRRVHLAIADAMENAGEADADALLGHLTAAGATERAARWLETAASNAMRAFAFDRAATLLRARIGELASHGHSAAALRVLRVRLGEALVGAGRGAEAADAFLAAAAGADAEIALELQRRSAEQLLTSGHLERGLSTLEPVLRNVGVDAPESRVRAAASLAWGRARLAARGFAFRERDAKNVPAEQLRRVDAIGAVAAALGMTDTIRGADLQTRHLHAALDAGEPFRLARALSLEGAFSATTGRKNAARTARVLGLAQSLADKTGDPVAVAQVDVGRGVAAFLEGRWAESRALLDAANGRLRDECSGVGVTFLIVSTNLYLLGALLHTGALAELAHRLPPLLEDASARGDRYALTHLRSASAAFIELLRDDPSAARREARLAIDAWTPSGTHMPHFFDVLAQAQIDLYEGATTRAVARAETGSSALRRALLFRVQFVRAKMTELRARTILAAMLASSSRSRLDARMQRRFEEELRDLLDEGAPWTTALAELLHGAARAARDGEDAARASFLRATDSCEAAGMALHAAIGRYRSGPRGKEEAIAWLEEQGVRAPSKLVTMLSPGAGPK